VTDDIEYKDRQVGDDGYRLYLESDHRPKKICVTVGGVDVWYETDSTCTWLLGQLVKAMKELEELKEAP